MKLLPKEALIKSLEDYLATPRDPEKELLWLREHGQAVLHVMMAIVQNVTFNGDKEKLQEDIEFFKEELGEMLNDKEFYDKHFPIYRNLLSRLQQDQANRVSNEK